MATLDFTIAKYLNCDVSEIHHRIQENTNLTYINKRLAGRIIATTYKKCFEEFYYLDITFTSASETYLFNGFITVEDLFLKETGIKLAHPYNPCVRERLLCDPYHSCCREDMICDYAKYYPLEVVRVIGKNRKILPTITDEWKEYDDGEYYLPTLSCKDF